MRAISQFVVRIMDLIEAEGSLLRAVIRVEASAARRDASGFAIGIAILSIAVPICVAGIGLLAAAVWSWLEPAAGAPAATAITGGALLMMGTALLGMFAYRSRRSKP